MRKQIIITIILLITTVAATVIYFKKINTPEAHVARVMSNIPNTAALIFEFSNDSSFYSFFSNSPLFTAVAGKDKINELAVLHKTLLLNPMLKQAFNGQHIYISLHGQLGNTIDFLFTAYGGEGFNNNILDQLSRQKNTGMVITNVALGNKEAYIIFFTGLKKRFYLVDNGNYIFAGSFSKDLALQSAQYKPATDSQDFIQLPDQQSSNSLANLYVNYVQLTPLFNQFFTNHNTGIFKSLRIMPAQAALTLNYKTDALMFNGFTDIQKGKPLSYLALFLDQQPVEGHLKDIFPSTTALSTSFMLSDAKLFAANLTRFYTNSGLTNEKILLFNKIKAETGLQLSTAFNNILSNEFAVVTTRYDEQFGIIALKDGSQMRPLMVNISNMVNDDMGQWKYNKLPFFLLGDTFSLFNHPYFMILDNYLILANSVNELTSFKDSYINHKFLNKTPGYADFDNLLTRRSNIAFFIHLKNVFPILKREMKPEFSPLFDSDKKRDKYYALSWQLSATEGNYYTNLYTRLIKPDTSATELNLSAIK